MASKNAVAHALKKRCHCTINAMGPNTPPEVFVYRGNAYTALQQPYFALADYNNASRVMKLSGQHQETCTKMLETLPSTLVGNYPSVDTHLHLLVKPLLNRKVELKKINDEFGRGIVAQKDMIAGEIVMQKSDPWMLYPLKDGLCSNCSRKLPDRHVTCTNRMCHEEYCSRDCRSHALQTYHGKVCENEGFQGIELDLFTQMQNAKNASERNTLGGYLLTLRVLASAMLGRSSPTTLPEVRTLAGKLTFDPKNVAGPLLDLYERTARFCGVTTSIFFEDFVGVYARIRSNCFQTDRSIVYHVPRSMLNHSCDPNVEFHRETQTMVTCREVKAGDELTISYYPHLNALPSEVRKAQLLSRDFDCKCKKCIAGY